MEFRGFEADAAKAGAGEPLASPGSMDAEESGDLYDSAAAIVLRDKKCSTSYIQRRLSVGYNKAASLVEQMEREGAVSPATIIRASARFSWAGGWTAGRSISRRRNSAFSPNSASLR